MKNFKLKSAIILALGMSLPGITLAAADDDVSISIMEMGATSTDAIVNQIEMPAHEEDEKHQEMDHENDDDHDADEQEEDEQEEDENEAHEEDQDDNQEDKDDDQEDRDEGDDSDDSDNNDSAPGTQQDS